MLRRVGVLAIAFLVAAAGGCARSAGFLRAIGSNRGAQWPAGTIHEDVFFSGALGVRKHVVVYLPPSYARDTTRRYPVATGRATT